MNKEQTDPQHTSPDDSRLTTHDSRLTTHDSRLTTHDSLLSKIFILPIRLYQLALSPMLGTHCRHTPSCSQYTIEAIAEWGPAKGIWLGMKRIARCHPWGTSGYDPVPKKQPR